MNLKKELADRMIVALARQGCKQSETAERLGIHQTEVSQLRRGVSQASLDKLIVIASRLGIKVEWRISECEPVPLPVKAAEQATPMEFDSNNDWMTD